MLFQAARPTVGEEESTSETYVAQLHNDKKHTCNAETQQNTESTDQDYLKTAKTHVRGTQLLWLLLALPHPAHATTRAANHTWFPLCPPAQQSATQYTTEADM